jgi:hypothetical protein
MVVPFYKKKNKQKRPKNTNVKKKREGDLFS